MKVSNPGILDGEVTTAKMANSVFQTQRFTADGTFTPDRAGIFCVIAQGGGGGGGAGGGGTAAGLDGWGGGGGNSGRLVATFVTLADTTPISVTIGGGGTGGTGASAAAGGAGTSGSNTTFGALVTAFGGAFGFSGPAGTINLGVGQAGYPGIGLEGGKGGTYITAADTNGAAGAAGAANTGGGGGGGGGGNSTTANTTGGAGGNGGSGWLIVFAIDK